MSRIDDRPKQTDSNGLDAGRGHLADHIDHLKFIERMQLGPICDDAARNLPGERSRHQGLGEPDREIEGLASPALAQREDVGVPRGG